MASIRWAAQGVSEGGVITVTKGAGTANGDRLVVIGVDDETAGDFRAPQSPLTSGGTWTTLSTSTEVADTPKGKVYEYKTTTDAASLRASWTFTPSGFVAGNVWMYCIQDLDPSSVIVVSWDNGTLPTSPAGSRLVTAPSISGYTGSDPILLTAHAIIANYENPTYSTPAGMDARGGVLDAQWMTGAGFSDELTGTGATGAKSSQLSLTTAYKWRAVAVAVPSAASSVPKSGSDSGVGSESGSVAAATSGSDSGVGSESGFVALLKSGSDAGVGSEDGFVSELHAGSDSGSGAEAGSISATTSGGDAGVGSESVALDVATEGSDSGTGAEAGFLTLPGSDTASGSSVLVALDATTSGGDTATGSEGGYVEELFGNLVVGIHAVDPDDGHLIPLPDHAKLSLSRERNGAGSISLDYPVDGLNFQVLRDTLTDDRDLEVEIWTIGSKSGALRGFLNQAAGDDVVEDRVWSFAGGFAELLLNEAVAFPAPIITTTTVTTTTKLSDDPPSYQVVKKTTVASSAGGPPVTSTVTTTESSGTEGTTTDSTSTKGDLEFEAVTPGELVNTLLDQAQDRTALTDMTRGFTDTHDSAGVLWPQVITSKFSPGSEYDSVLGRLVDFGLAEWGVTWTGTAYRLDLWVIFGRGVDRTTGLRPIVLRKARNLLDAPRKWSVRDAGTTVLAAGSEGVYEHASDVDALARRGRRIERFASASNLTDPAAVQAFAQNQLVLTTAGELEVNHGIGFLPGEPRPVVAFDIGDWVYSETSGSAGRERLRVVQWTLGVDDGGASGTVTLNDTITDALSRLQARIDNLVSGDTVVGTSTSSGGQDNSTPLPPEVLSADSVAFLDGTLGVRAAVTVALDMPVLNVDGTVITDMESVVVQFALASSPDVWNAGITKRAPTSSATFTAPAGQTINIRAAVVDRNGNTSVWSDPPFPITTSNDDIPPPVPSTPTVSEYLGTVRINWDGLTADGAVMYEAALDFDHVEIHLSPGSLFTPSESTLVATVTSGGTWTVTDLPYGVTQFARLVAVDWSGNKSAASAQGSATPIENGPLDYQNLSIGTGKIIDLSVGKLAAGTLNVDVILGSYIRTALTGNRVEISGGGIQLFNGSNVMVDFKTSNGSALVVGEFRTALSGQRIVFNPSGALADTMNFYPNAAGDFARIMSRTAPADGTAAILIDGGAANGTARGRVGAYKGEAFISHVTQDSGGDTSAGFSTTAVSCTPTRINAWVRDQFYFWQVNSSNNVVSGTTTGLFWSFSGAVSGQAPCLTGPHNSGIKMDLNELVAVNGTGTAAQTFTCLALQQTSTKHAKTDIVPIGDVFSPSDVVWGAESRAWRYKAEAENGSAPLRFGPIAEDLPDVLLRQTSRPDGKGVYKAVDHGSQIGVLWGVCRELIGRVNELADSKDARLDELERRIQGSEAENN